MQRSHAPRQRAEQSHGQPHARHYQPDSFRARRVGGGRELGGWVNSMEGVLSDEFTGRPMGSPFSFWAQA